MCTLYNSIKFLSFIFKDIGHSDFIFRAIQAIVYRNWRSSVLKNWRKIENVRMKCDDRWQGVYASSNMQGDRDRRARRPGSLMSQS